MLAPLLLCLSLPVRRYLGCCLVLLGFLLLPLGIRAQRAAEAFIEWDDFVEEYLQYAAEQAEAREQTAPLRDEIDALEALALAPLPLNSASRDDLLRLSFLSSAQVDSLLAYRQRAGRFLSVGELMAVRGLSLRERRWLSLFLSFEAPNPPLPSLRELLRGGRSELDFSADIPFYLRDGYRTRQSDGSPKPATQRYLGAPTAQRLRYRYHYAQRLSYGLSAHRDAGEPIFAAGNSLADAYSAYLHLRAPQGQWQLLVGDYQLHFAQGLVMGEGFYCSPLSLLRAGRGVQLRLRPHTGLSETDFQRGAAYVRQWQRFGLALFVAHRGVDARRDGDTLRTLYHSGLHRSLAELRAKNSAQLTQLGLQASLSALGSRFALSLAHSQLSAPYAPEPRRWNQHASQGGGATALSLAHSTQRRLWSTEGEISLDRRGHLALSEQLSFRPSATLQLGGQLRHFAVAYLAPQARTLQQATHVQNETGLTLVLRTLPARNTELQAFLDLYRFPAPTFRASQAARGLEAALELSRHSPRGFTHSLRYTFRSREQDIPQHPALLEFRSRHSLRLSQQREGRTFSRQIALSLSAQHRQTQATPTFGSLLSARYTLRPSATLRLSAFLAAFYGAATAPRLYAYEPQLRGLGAFPSFGGKGLAAVLLARWQLLRHLEGSARFSWRSYFDRTAISSGLQRIAQPTQLDASLALRYAF